MAAPARSKPNTSNGLAVTLEPAAGGAQTKIETDIVLVSIGRKPFTENLGLISVGVKLDGRGRIVTDAHFKTSVPGIWAIGCLLYTSPSPRDRQKSRMPSS